MNIESQIRLLARNSYYQQIFSSSEKCSGIQIFKNQNNFSGLQALFLYWVKIYSMLYEELYSLEWDNLDDAVLKDDDRCSAFLYWRRKEQEKRIRKNKKDEKKSNKKQNSIPIFQGAKNKEIKGDK